MSRDEKKGKAIDESLLELAPGLMDLLSHVHRVELEHIELEVGDLEIWLNPSVLLSSLTGCGIAEPKPQAKPTALIPEVYMPEHEEYPGRIREITLGATKGDGGSRGRTVTIGGATHPAYTSLENPPPHPPVISMDVFDYLVPLPKTLKKPFEEVMGDPAEWARLLVEKYRADLVTVHLLSTDPLIKDTPPREAARTVEGVLQAVDVPLVIGGCGDPKKDPLVFAEVGEMAHGEGLLLNSVTLDMAEAQTLETVARTAQDHGHKVLAFSPLELNSAKELNRRLYEYLPPESIVMDLTTVALGYGLEYSFSIHERARLAALSGDTELQHPTSSGSTNAWAAREAWMKLDPAYGPLEIRGPIWETLNALILLLAGVDLFMMMHPAAIRTLREVIHRLQETGTAPSRAPADWVTARM